MFDFLTNGCGFGEILFMLAVAAFLGWLLRHFMDMGDDNNNNDHQEHHAQQIQPMAGTMSVNDNDLKVVEGIGPKIEELLKSDGINTWAELAVVNPSRLQSILDAAGNRFKMHDPKTWPEQAEMAHEGKWDELKEYQDFLSGGRA